MTTQETPGSLGFPDAPAVATANPELQRLRAAVEAKLVGRDVQPVRVGRFTLLERVGAGAMGIVYAAYDAELDRKVAIKMLHPSADDSGVRTRLQSEAQAMARLSHPNVIAVYEIGDHEGCGFVAMEFVRGRTLRQWLADEPRSRSDILDRYEQAGRGLAAAHAAGVVHRDFKPDNVLLGDDPSGASAADRVRVVDFGLARTEPAEVPGMRIGTPGYMAPEQILGEPTDARSDQFAFCVALWEALVGTRPFGGDTVNELFPAVLAGSIRAPSRAAMPGWIEAALRRGLATRPEDRHASMDVLLRTLTTDPRRRRRRGVAIVLGIAAVPAVLGAVRMRTAMRADACERSAAAIDEVWNGDAESRVRGAFAASGAPNAATMSDKAIPQVADYAEHWRAAANTTCTAIEIDGTLDAAEAEQAIACLSRSRDGFATLVDALEHADALSVEGAVFSVLRLPAPARCTDARALALEPRLPDDPGLRDEIRLIETEVDAADTLRRLGHDREALARLTPLLERAEALHWPALEGTVRFHLAQLHRGLDEDDRARVLGEEAFLASYLAGDDAMAAMSASLLLTHFGVVEYDAERARLWDEIATAAIGRAAERGRSAAIFHAVAKARWASVRGDADEAEDALRRALVVGEQLYGPDHLAITDHLLMLADVQCVRGDYSECRATSQRAYDILSAAAGDEHPRTARALAELGLATHWDGDSETAVRRLQGALALDERYHGPEHLNVAVDLSYLAVVMQETGAGAQAVAMLDRAIPIMERVYGPEHPEVELLLGNLGRAHETAGNLVAARSTLQRALAMHERNGSTRDDTRVSNEESLANVEAALQARPERAR